MDYQTSMVKHSKAIAVTAQEMVSIQSTCLSNMNFIFVEEMVKYLDMNQF